jgi:hypothetical protein
MNLSTRELFSVGRARFAKQAGLLVSSSFRSSVSGSFL